jgi:hypothetical protein
MYGFLWFFWLNHEKRSKRRTREPSCSVVYDDFPKKTVGTIPDQGSPCTTVKSVKRSTSYGNTEFETNHK